MLGSTQSVKGVNITLTFCEIRRVLVCTSAYELWLKNQVYRWACKNLGGLQENNRNSAQKPFVDSAAYSFSLG